MSKVESEKEFVVRRECSIEFLKSFADLAQKCTSYTINLSDSSGNLCNARDYEQLRRLNLIPGTRARIYAQGSDAAEEVVALLGILGGGYEMDARSMENVTINIRVSGLAFALAVWAVRVTSGWIKRYFVHRAQDSIGCQRRQRVPGILHR